MTRLSLREPGRMGQNAPRIVRSRELGTDAIFGTWDFKWPTDSRIRVAFQFPHWLAPATEGSNAIFLRVASFIRQRAELWGGAAVHFDWLDLEGGKMPSVLFAPFVDAATDRSSTVLRPSSSRFGEATYDVLVSLDELSRDGSSHQGDSGQQRRGTRFALPSAELGAYNRRADYGVPTVYLGPLGAWREVYPNLPFEDYYSATASPNDLQKLARFHIAHEFGHVLGLVHAHQDPVRRHKIDPSLNWPRPDATPNDLEGRLVAVLRDRLHLSETYLQTDTLSQQLLKSHVTMPWPGNILHSDWSTAQGPSVMTVPYLHCLVGGGSASGSCAACESPQWLPQEPTVGDLQFFKGLY